MAKWCGVKYNRPIYSVSTFYLRILNASISSNKSRISEFRPIEIIGVVYLLYPIAEFTAIGTSMILQRGMRYPYKNPNRLRCTLDLIF